MKCAAPPPTCKTNKPSSCPRRQQLDPQLHNLLTKRQRTTLVKVSWASPLSEFEPVKTVESIPVAAASVGEIPIPTPAHEVPRPLSIEPETFVLESKERKPRSVRPLITNGSSWPTPATPYEPARKELPFCQVTPIEWDHAHGVSSNTIRELESVTRLQRLQLPNNPPVRPAREPARQQVPTRLPRPGCFYDLFTHEDSETFTFYPDKHGPWVKQMLKLRKRKQHGSKAFIKLTPQQIEAEIINWFAVASNDFQDAEIWKRNAGCVGATFKPKAKTFIVPPQAFAPWARNVIWDTKAYFDAPPHERESIQIYPQNWSIPAEEPWNMDRLREWGIKSRCTDLCGLQDITDQGVSVPFTGIWSMVLQTAATGFFDKLEIGQKTTLEEIEEGLLWSPTMGPPLTPCKLSSRNIARTFKIDKIKDRCTANLSGPDDEALHDHSVNVGFALEEDKESYPELDFTSPPRLAFTAATLITACGPNFCICKNDWARFYRQLRKSPEHFWLQAAITLSAGATIDVRLIFGDASACSSSNRIESILVWIIRWLVFESWNMGPDPMKWYDSLLKLPWMNPKIAAWISDRAETWGVPQAQDSFQTSVATIWNLIPASISGYFDDGIYMGHTEICNQFDSAIFRLMSLGVEAQMVTSPPLPPPFIFITRRNKVNDYKYDTLRQTETPHPLDRTRAVARGSL